MLEKAERFEVFDSLDSLEKKQVSLLFNPFEKVQV